jgi:hypothetical protein
MASGMMGTLRLNDEDGKPMLVKGRVVKVTEKVEEKVGKDGKTAAEVFRDRFVSTVAILCQSGIEIIDQVEPLSKFMHRYGDQLGAHILSTYRPLYNFDPTPEETAILDILGTKRKPLPGQEKPGLLPAQRHIATALSRVIKIHNVGNMQKEMGTGGTIMSIATFDLLNAYPAIVLCPPHLVPKWIREIEETVPGAKAMEISRIGRNADDPGDVNDVRRFLDLHSQGKLGSKPVAVIAHTSAKYGAGWEHAVVRKWFVEEEDHKPFEALACPECGAPIQIDMPGGATVIATSIDELGEQRHFCRAQRVGYELDDKGRLERDESGNPIWGKRVCGAPLFQFTGRRWAPADYIAKHAKNKFQMLVADECFVKDTRIETNEGPKAIQDIRVGDLVLSFNHACGQLEYRKVLHTMKNPAPQRLIRAAGIVCTPNHPIFTEEESYVEAQKICGKTVRVLRKNLYGLPQRQNDSALLLPILRIFQSFARGQKESGRCTSQTDGKKVMSRMWQSVLSPTDGSVVCKAKVLLTRLQRSVSISGPGGRQVVCRKNVAWRKWLGRNQATGYRRADENQKSHVRSRCKGESTAGTGRQNLSLPRWQRTTHLATDGIVPSAWPARVGNGVCDPHGPGEGLFRIVTHSIQSGSGYPRGGVGHRSRWAHAQIEEVENSRPPQNGGLEFSRVDRVEILERGSESGFEQVCPDGVVYNFEVEGNNNYFANGVLVHNCHQFKSKSSDRGVAFHQLVGATRYTLTLTGTFFGGKSTSIFWLLHRLNAGVRRDFAFNDEKRWARLYGVLEMTRKSKRTTDDDEDGFTGNRRYQNQAKEQPGVSPAIVNRLLDTTVFLSLKDLGLSLPHYAEEVVTLSMTDEQGGQYRKMGKETARPGAQQSPLSLDLAAMDSGASQLRFP